MINRLIGKTEVEEIVKYKKKKNLDRRMIHSEQLICKFRQQKLIPVIVLKQRSSTLENLDKTM